MFKNLLDSLKNYGLVSYAGEGERKLFSPINGEHYFSTKKLDASDINLAITAANLAQEQLEEAKQSDIIKFLKHLANEVENHQEVLANCILFDAGKVTSEGLIEAKNITTTINKTIADSSFTDEGEIARVKKPIPAGIVTLITSYNFPLSVAGWTFAPALLAGNSVIWKPSGKTPLVAHLFKEIFDKAVHNFKNKNISPDLLQIADCDRTEAAALLTDPRCKVISATGSVAMGMAISQALASRQDSFLSPLLELGGNNAVVVSESLEAKQIDFTVDSILKSYLVSTGQRCTNTRRIIVHSSNKDLFIKTLKAKLSSFIDSGNIMPANNDKPNNYGYAALVDKKAFSSFENAINEASKLGADIYFGNRILNDEYPNAFYVEPAIVDCKEHYELLDEEVFAPLLYVVEYSDIEEAIKLVNTPENAGLVNGIYSSKQSEIDYFIKYNQAGHGVINMDKGTGTPAHSMGFGGNKMSGTGEILAPYPLDNFSMGYNKFVINTKFKTN